MRIDGLGVAMMLGRTLAVVTLGAALMPGNVWAAGYAVDSQSATAAAMGGVGVANPNETNTSFYNPALTPHRDLVISIGGMPSVRNTQYTAPSGQRFDGDSTTLPFPSLNVSYAFGALGFGLGVNRPFAHSVRYTGGAGPNARKLIRWGIATQNLTPNVAYAISDDLSVSVGGQFMWSSIELKRNVTTPLGEEGIGDLSASGFGLGVSGAVFYEPIENLSLGLNYQSGTKIDYEGDVTFIGVNGDSLIGGVEDQSITSTIRFPHRVTAGVGYSLERLWVGVDVGLTTWSSYDKNAIKFSEPCNLGSATCDPVKDSTDPPIARFPAAWENVMNIRFGAQYQALETLQLRAGFAYDPTPIPDETVNASNPQGDRTIIGTGAGFQGEYLRVDASYQFITDSREIQNGVDDGVYRNVEHVLGITMTLEFEP